MRHQGVGCGSEIVAAHSHVEKPVDRSGRVVGVERRKDRMPGKGRLHGDIGRLLVADFTDHHDVWVLAKERAERGGESVSVLLADLGLQNTLELVLDRVLDGDDFYLRIV